MSAAAVMVSALTLRNPLQVYLFMVSIKVKGSQCVQTGSVPENSGAFHCRCSGALPKVQSTAFPDLLTEKPASNPFEIRMFAILVIALSASPGASLVGFTVKECDCVHCLIWFLARLD